MLENGIRRKRNHFNLSCVAGGLKREVHGVQSPQIGVKNPCIFWKVLQWNKREMPIDFTSLHKTQGFLDQIYVDCAPCISRLRGWHYSNFAAYHDGFLPVSGVVNHLGMGIPYVRQSNLEMLYSAKFVCCTIFFVAKSSGQKSLFHFLWILLWWTSFPGT